MTCKEFEEYVEKTFTDREVTIAELSVLFGHVTTCPIHSIEALKSELESSDAVIELVELTLDIYELLIKPLGQYISAEDERKCRVLAKKMAQEILDV